MMTSILYSPRAISGSALSVRIWVLVESLFSNKDLQSRCRSISKRRSTVPASIARMSSRPWRSRLPMCAPNGGDLTQTTCWLPRRSGFIRSVDEHPGTGNTDEPAI